MSLSIQIKVVYIFITKRFYCFLTMTLFIKNIYIINHNISNRLIVEIDKLTAVNMQQNFIIYGKLSL